MSSSQKLQDILRLIDQVNHEDPKKQTIDGKEISNEVLYSQRMQQCLQQFHPEATDALQIAAYAQHIKRWAIPRDSYPMDKAGYKKWRTDLGKFHADTTGQLMTEVGYDQEMIERVKYLLQKKGLKRDTETQTLEDVICLVFMEHYLNDFASKHSEEKLIGIIQKTWRKMSAKGHTSALELPFSNPLLELINKALNSSNSP